eukprot:RCo050295
MMALSTLVVLYLVVTAWSKVLLEVSFDLALQQESPTGYTASHTVGEYLEDRNLNYIRYFHTLVSGQPRTSNMRFAHLEFDDIHGWSEFETTNMERTHILYDLFWINWRRVLWTESADTEALVRRPQPDGKLGGYVFTFRFSVEDGKAAEFKKFRDAAHSKIVKELESNPGYIVRHQYTAGIFQNEYEEMCAIEFVTLPSLSSSMFENEVISGLLTEMKDKFLENWSVTILVPSTDAQGGVIFRGAGADDKGK